MKTKGIVSTGCFFMLAVIFTSCSTSVDIAKRQFNSGYYVHVNTPKHQPETAVITQRAVPVAAAGNGNIVPAYGTQKNNAIVEQEEVISSGSSFSASAENKHPVRTSKKMKAAVVSAEVIATENSILETQKHVYSSRRMDRISNRLALRGDTPDIVLILLCLFLPFIAVGIVDHWGTRFLIDILLCLLFWIPGVIYAFIVCFA